MTAKRRFLNNGSADTPCLRVYLNLDTLVDHPGFNLHDTAGRNACIHRVHADGFEGVQYTNKFQFESGPETAYCGTDRINTPSEADSVALRHADRGDLCITVHVGWGIEDDAEAYRLVEEVLKASLKHSLPMFIETHRGTITQDIWRTVQLTKEFPEVCFNGDFSHYYCGQEMVYGDWTRRLAFLEPIFSRVGFMHGRVASPGCMQVPIDPDFEVRPRQAHGSADYLKHFKELWIHAMVGFLHSAAPGDFLIFAPELLSGRSYYARMFPDQSGHLVEECDRYEQALLYRELARACFAEARRMASESVGNIFKEIRG